MTENQPPVVQWEAHRPWEHQATFQEALGNQLRMAPYFLVSLAIHALIGLFFASVAALTPEKEHKMQLEVVAPPPPPPVEEQEEEPPPPEEEIVEEPVLQEAEIEETVTQETLEVTGDPNFTSDAAFDSDAWNNAVGLGGGAGGLRGGRGGRGGRRGGTPTEQAVEDALKWLADHQTEEGFWDCDEFFYWDKYKDQPPSDGPGNAVNDVGVTGLALLAFLGAGNTMSSGPYKEVVSKGISWLKDIQLENGLFGEEGPQSVLYNHSIAAMAMGEAYIFSKSPLLKRSLEGAVKVILNARNTYGAWRYSLDPNGDNDTSITGWMVFALETARDAGIAVDAQAFEGAETWFAQMTDQASGRTGYHIEYGPGSRPSRKQQYIERWPPEKSESLTAVALLCRVFMAPRNLNSWKEHPNYAMLQKQADLCIKTPPIWDVEGGSIDFYYWYYATFALYQWGGKHWDTWRTAIEKVLPPNQRKDGNFKGSWDPQVDPWGDEGGRVYTTATGCIILEVYYRYAKVLGAR